jgi:hypothetical protein
VLVLDEELATIDRRAQPDLGVQPSLGTLSRPVAATGCCRGFVWE